MEYIFKCLTSEDLPQMHKTFNSAFADYKLPFQLSFEEFIKKFILKLNINFSLSAGAFLGNEIVGFIFTGTAIYRGLKTAYNGGSGVVPSHRGQNITFKMYEYLLPLFHKNEIEQCVLEVLTDNKTAIKTYHSCGFSVSSLYQCFKIEKDFLQNEKTPSLNISVQRTENANWPRYHFFFDTAPSYLDSTPVLKHNLPKEHLAEALFDQETIGYIIFQPEASRISQIAVSKKFRRKGVATALVKYAFENSAANQLSIINIDDKERETIDAIKQLGFRNTVNQYEMVKKII